MARFKKIYLIPLVIGLIILIRLLSHVSEHARKKSQPFDTSDLRTKLVRVETDGESRDQRLRRRLSSVVEGYCNFPEDIALGTEGLPPDDYKLVSVTVLLRHGNRLPMPDAMPIGPMTIPEVSCILDPGKSYRPELMNRFIEKTARRPEKSKWPFSLSPQESQCEAAGLTQIGVEQHLRNGFLLREAYNDLLGGLQQKDVNVVSTVRSRTYQSAMAFLYGLLDERVDYNTLNIDPSYSTTFCRLDVVADCQCNKAAEYLAKGEATLRKLRRTDGHFKNFTNTIKSLLGDSYDIKSYYPWKTAHDLYASRLCRKENLPCKHGVCFTESQANMNWRSLSTYYQVMSQNSDIMIYSQLAVFYFLQDIVTRLNKQATGSQSSKKEMFTVYSGHDNTITPLLMALGIPVDHWPPFASRFVIELYAPRSGSQRPKDHLIKFIYNGEDVTRQLKFCITRVGWSNSGCALVDFTNYYNNLLMNMGTSTYESACSTDKV